MNLSLVSPMQMVFAASAAPVAVGAAISNEHTQLVATLAVTVAAIAGAIAWIEARIERGRKVNHALILELKEDLKAIHKTIHSVELNGCAQRCTDPQHRRTPLPAVGAE